MFYKFQIIVTHNKNPQATFNKIFQCFTNFKLLQRITKIRKQLLTKSSNVFFMIANLIQRFFIYSKDFSKIVQRFFDKTFF